MRTTGFRVGMTALALVCGICTAQERATLDAVVTGENGPIEGATTFIWTARPREGPTMFCPSCYLDCGKRAMSDAEGHVKIESLDPTLLFNLMTVAEGYMPSESGILDPAAGSVEVVLKPHPEFPDEPGHWVTGRVVDAEGDPVAQAVVTAYMFYFPRDPKTRGQTGSSFVEGADPLAVTDAEGRFRIGSPKAVESVTVRVEARNLATRLMGGLPVDDPTNTVQLNKGAAIAGSLVDANGKPLAHRTVGVCQTSHLSNTFVGDYSIDTDENGHFLFVNLPPEQEMIVYTKWASVSGLGAATPVVLKTGSSGTTTEGVELRLTPGHRFSGRIVLEDGKPLPEGKCVMIIGGNSIWDSCPEWVLPGTGLSSSRASPPSRT